MLQLLLACYKALLLFIQNISKFWLAKSTRIIHHKHLLMTKFGRILCLRRKWRQKCRLLQVNAPLTEKTCGRGWVVFVLKTKMADTSLVSRLRTAAGTKRNNGFWKNNKTIIEFGFRIIWTIMEISEGVIRLGVRSRRITPSSISIILHKILSLTHC